MDRAVTTNIKTAQTTHGKLHKLSSVARFMAGTTMSTLSAAQSLLHRFRRDERGTFVIIAAVAMPVLIGIVGLGAEVSLWHTMQQKQQNAADSSALTAATAYYLDSASSANTYARSVSATYGYIHGENGTTITVNRPPLTGNYTTKNLAVEVIVEQTQSRLFSKFFINNAQVIKARAVAFATGASGCVMSLSGSASNAVKISGGANVNLTACSLISNSSANPAVSVIGSSQLTALSVETVGSVSGTSNITAQNGINTGVEAALDPYADVPMPTKPAGNCVNPPNSGNPQPNTFYCKLDYHSASDNITLSPGTYFIGSGNMKVNGGATVTGTGVTLVFTNSSGNNYGTMDLEGGTVTLTAPTSGPTAGIAVFGDRNAPASEDYVFNGGSTMNLTGAIYAPSAEVRYAGGNNSPTSCLQLIANTVVFTGNANFAINCQGKGTKSIASTISKLVE